MLEIDPEDDSEDVRLSFWLRMACGVIEQYLDRPLFKQERTEYLRGTGTQKLVLRCRPVYVSPAPRVWVDANGKFGQSSGAFSAEKEITLGDNFSLWVDDDDGSKSHKGILIKDQGLWEKVSRRQAGYLSPFVDENWGTIKVVYTAGYAAEDLPEEIVLACVQTVARIRFMMPLGMQLNSDSFGGRSISLGTNERNWLLGQTKHLLFSHRNRKFG